VVLTKPNHCNDYDSSSFDEGVVGHHFMWNCISVREIYVDLDPMTGLKGTSS